MSMKEIQINDQGMTIIPEGYKWCHGCESLTPYREHEDLEGSYYCEVCDCFSTGHLECPNCGCDEREDCLDSRVVVKHRDGCHDKDDDEKCSWPVYSHAEKVFRLFKHDFLKQAPDRGAYSLPKDQEWFDKNKALKRKLSEYVKRTKCSCPRFTIFNNIHQIVTDSYSYPSMDCGTGYFWRYKVRCPVCGCIFENEGDSC